MYMFVDLPVDRLSQGSRFVLWAMRGWTAAIGGVACPPRSLAPGFAKMGLLSALPDVHMAMMLFNKHARDTLRFSCMATKTICEDEAILLHVWRDAAAGAEAQVDRTLALLVEEEFARPLRAALMLAAGKFAAARMSPTGLLPDTVARP